MKPSPSYRNYRRTNEFTFEIRQGGGCLSVFGLPFLAAGVFIILGGLGIIPVERSGDLGEWTQLVMFFFSLPFIGAGGAMLFGRSLTVLDLSKSVITMQWRFLVWPFKQWEYPLRDYDAVTFRFSPGDSDTADTYPVGLHPRGNAKTITLDSPTDFAAARNLAADVSYFLKVPLRDETVREPVVLTPDDARKSFAKRLKENLAARSGLPSRPALMHCNIDDTNGTLTVALPVTGLRLWRVLLGSVPLVFLAFFIPGMLEFFNSTRTPVFVHYFFSGFLLLGFALPAFMGIVGIVLNARISRQVLKIHSREIILEERTWRTRQMTVLVSDDIYDVQCVTRKDVLGALSQAGSSPEPSARSAGASEAAQVKWVRGLTRWASSKGIIIKSRQGIFTFGAGLADEELIYLCALIHNRLTEN